MYFMAPGPFSHPSSDLVAPILLFFLPWLDEKPLKWLVFAFQRKSEII
jgi:hypothetical protein